MFYLLCSIHFPNVGRKQDKGEDNTEASTECARTGENGMTVSVQGGHDQGVEQQGGVHGGQLGLEIGGRGGQKDAQ